MFKILRVFFIFAVIAVPVRANFIVNGSFTQGNTGFSTTYIYTPGNIGGQNTYDILANPYPAHPSAASFGDHTTGTGLMMAVNESLTPNSLIWSQTILVSTNVDYDFSIWSASWVSAAPSRINVLFNGDSIGVVQAPNVTGVWQQFTSTWNSQANTSLTIELRNVTSADIGGDFALDDISLTSSVPEPSAFACLASFMCFSALRRNRRSLA